MYSSELTTEQFIQKVGDFSTMPKSFKYIGQKAAILMFYLSWCGHCQKMKPITEGVVERYNGDVLLYLIDAEKQTALSDAFGVESVPMFVFLAPDGTREVFIGEMSSETINSHILQHLKK